MTKQDSKYINTSNLSEELDSGSINIGENKSEINNLLSESQKENTKLTDKVENLENAQDIIFEQFKTLELQRLDLEKQQKSLGVSLW